MRAFWIIPVACMLAICSCKEKCGGGGTIIDDYLLRHTNVSRLHYGATNPHDTTQYEPRFRWSTSAINTDKTAPIIATFSVNLIEDEMIVPIDVVASGKFLSLSEDYEFFESLPIVDTTNGFLRYSASFPLMYDQDFDYCSVSADYSVTLNFDSTNLSISTDSLFQKVFAHGAITLEYVEALID